MGFTYRIATPADRDAYIDFINYVFSHDHQPHDFKALLPKEYGDGRESRAAHFLALDDEGHIRGCVAALPFTVRVLDQDLKYAYIGSVSVHPYARGEGHMKHLMAMVEAWLVEQQVDAAVLGGQRQRYQYFGYSKGGMSVRYDFSFDNARHALRNVSTDGWSVEEITDAQDPRLAEMHALHAAQPVHVLREPEHFLDICSSWYNRPYAFLKDGKVAGYVSANREHSIAEFIMADAADYPAAARLWMDSTGARRIDILAQPHELDLTAFLNDVAEDGMISSAENLRIFNWKKTLPAYLALKLSLNGLSDGDCRLWVDDRPLHVACRDGHLTVDDQVSEDAPHFTSLKLQEMLFFPAMLLHPCCVGGAPKDWFPLPLSVPPCDGF